MFAALLSNLAFNPGLINQVAFYSKRLKQETTVRRLGFVMVGLGMVVQMFAVLYPAEPTLALSNNDVIRGGFSSKEAAVNKCTANEAGFKTILSHFGISCTSLVSSTTKNIRSTNYDGQLYSMGRLPYGKPGEVTVNVPNAGTFYMRPLGSWDSGSYSTYKVLSGTRDNGTPFMILYNCGNLTIVGPPETAPPPPPAPVPPPATPPQFTPGNATCRSLTATRLSDYAYRFKATTAGTDFVVKSYHFDFGDGNSKTINTGLYGASVEHTYNRTGNFTIKATIAVNVQGSSGVLSRSLTCQTNITVTAPTPPAVTPPPPPPTAPPCPYNPELPKSSPSCKPCDESQDQNDATACLVLSKTARNDTQNIDKADGTMARGGDAITYTLSVTNTGKETVKNFVVQENISDILDYATVTNAYGSSTDERNLAQWPATDIAPGQTITKQLGITIKNPVPQTPISASDAASFDLTLTNVYGDTVNIKLPPTIVKTTEQITRTLPNTGPGASLVGVFSLTTIAGYFFARSRLLAKELDLVRHDYAASGGA